VSLDALLAANKDTIKNPNRIRVGDEIIIPLPETEEVPSEASASPSG
jgi:nucleoid-associated protein YgaU